MAIDQKINERLGELVDYIIHFGEEKIIWNIPAIRIQNGVIKKDLRMVPNKIKDKVIFVGLGKLWDWWGLDIFIKAIKEYHNKKDGIQIELIILGDGKEMKRLRNLVKSLDLESCINFIGAVPENLIYSMLQKAHLGVGTLAINRKKVKYASSLKHREYASYGLPFFFVGEDKDFSAVSGALSIKTEKQLNVASLIEWHNQLDQNLVVQSLKGYADEELSWAVKLDPIVKLL